MIISSRKTASRKKEFDLVVPHIIKPLDDSGFVLVRHGLHPDSVGSCQDSEGGDSPDRLSPLFKGARLCGISIRTAQMKISFATMLPFDAITADAFTSSVGFTRTVVISRSAERPCLTSKVAETKASLGLSSLCLPKNHDNCPKTRYESGVIRQSHRRVRCSLYGDSRIVRFSGAGNAREWCMILPENRHPLFRIMHGEAQDLRSPVGAAVQDRTLRTVSRSMA